MLILLFAIGLSFAYCEWVWSLVKSGEKTYDKAKYILKVMAGVNYVLAVLVGAWGCLVYAAIISLYHLVIFEQRKPNLNGPVA